MRREGARVAAGASTAITGTPGDPARVPAGREWATGNGPKDRLAILTTTTAASSAAPDGSEPASADRFGAGLETAVDAEAVRQFGDDAAYGARRQPQLPPGGFVGMPGVQQP